MALGCNHICAYRCFVPRERSRHAKALLLGEDDGAECVGQQAARAELTALTMFCEDAEDTAKSGMILGNGSERIVDDRACRQR